MPEPPLEQVINRLEQNQIIWFASVRPDGRPHLAPVWFVWHHGKIYISTDPKSVKVHNLYQNPRVSLALEDGLHPVISEGIARQILPPWDPGLLDVFQKKYDWDLTTEAQYNDVWEITPEKWISW